MGYKRDKGNLRIKENDKKNDDDDKGHGNRKRRQHVHVQTPTTAPRHGKYKTVWISISIQVRRPPSQSLVFVNIRDFSTEITWLVDPNANDRPIT